MENRQFEMFKNRKSSEIAVISEHTIDKNNSDQISITCTDHHIIEIVSTYINKLPDIKTRKYLARIMINFIMKSAKL